MIPSARQALFATVASAGLVFSSTSFGQDNPHDPISNDNNLQIAQVQNTLSDIAGKIYDAQKALSQSVDQTPDGTDIIGDYDVLTLPVLESIMDDIGNGVTNPETIANNALNAISNIQSTQDIDASNTDPDVLKQSQIISRILTIAVANHVEQQDTRASASVVLTSIIANAASGQTNDLKVLTEIGMETMMKSLDPHSSYQYITPRRLEQNQNRSAGTFSGIGVQVSIDYEIDDPDNIPENPILQNGLKIQSTIIDEGPAALAGVQEGDVITHVNGTPLAGLTVAQSVELIKGPTGSDVNLTIDRAGTSMDVAVTRGPIPQSPITSRMFKNNVGYIRAQAFNDQTDKYMDRAIQELEALGAEQFILDLRYNPGGAIMQADHVIENFMDGEQALLDYWDARNAAMTTLFEAKKQRFAEKLRAEHPTITDEELEQALEARRQEYLLTEEEFNSLPAPTAEQQEMVERNTSVNMRRRDGKEPQFYITPGVETDKPMVVLINEYSASASELVAGALQDFGRATIIGTQSFGKGSAHINAPIDVDNDGQPDALITLTTGLYYIGPAGGRSIHGTGVTPDIRLSEEFKYVSAPTRTEADLASAIATPSDSNDNTRSNSECRPANEQAAIADIDPWVECAMNYFAGTAQAPNVTIIPLDQAAAPTLLAPEQ